MNLRAESQFVLIPGGGIEVRQVHMGTALLPVATVRSRRIQSPISGAWDDVPSMFLEYKLVRNDFACCCMAGSFHVQVFAETSDQERVAEVTTVIESLVYARPRFRLVSPRERRQRARRGTKRRLGCKRIEQWEWTEDFARWVTAGSFYIDVVRAFSVAVDDSRATVPGRPHDT